MTEQIETTEQTESSRKSLPLEISRKADGIVKRLKPSEVVKALLFRAKKDFAMEYLMTGNLNEDGPSKQQIVASLYFGAEYEYGPANKRQKMYLPADPETIKEIADQVPEEECKTPVAKKSTSIKEVKREAMMNTAKTMLKFNVPMEAIIASTGLTIEEIEALKGE